MRRRGGLPIAGNGRVRAAVITYEKVRMTGAIRSKAVDMMNDMVRRVVG